MYQLRSGVAGLESVSIRTMFIWTQDRIRRKCSEILFLYCHLHALGEEDLLGHALLDDLLEVLVLLVLLPQPQVLLLEGADLQYSTVQYSTVQYSTVQRRPS